MNPCNFVVKTAHQFVFWYIDVIHDLIYYVMVFLLFSIEMSDIFIAFFSCMVDHMKLLIHIYDCLFMRG